MEKTLDFTPDEILEILQKAHQEKGSRLSKKEKSQAIKAARIKTLAIEKAFDDRKKARIALDKKKMIQREKAEKGQVFSWSSSVNRPVR
ncbi:hypothetical protein [Photobacterium iliopiscarium]|uniref:hypothetical protein n=2 Tax=Photobacterium iliopiscarium TaxID=56192 RepID=UPI001F43F7E5|nr:hypothetical protein [Photobacterium iliopiscarium]MCF2245830.1 hypothetical protein [Photobacterium iliopiscarium]